MKKNENIDTLKNNVKYLEKENLKIMAISNNNYEESDKLKKINNTNNKKVQELEEKLEEK